MTSACRRSRHGSKEGHPAGPAVCLSLPPASLPEMAQADAAKRHDFSAVLCAAAGQGVPGPHGVVPAILEPCHRPLHLAGARMQWAGAGHKNVSSPCIAYQQHFPKTTFAIPATSGAEALRRDSARAAGVANGGVRTPHKLSPCMAKLAYPMHVLGNEDGYLQQAAEHSPLEASVL